MKRKKKHEEGGIIMRDPRTEPEEGDILRSSKDDKKIIIDIIKDDYVYYRVFCSNELIAFYKSTLSNFLRLAPEQCLPAQGGS